MVFEKKHQRSYLTFSLRVHKILTLNSNLIFLLHCGHFYAHAKIVQNVHNKSTNLINHFLNSTRKILETFKIRTYDYKLLILMYAVLLATFLN